MNKILTIIIPTYNMEKYLRQCLNSLLCDAMDMLEVIVINDGSRDSSSAIAHEYEANYPGMFRVIDKKNGNYGSCINRGLKEVTGKYVKVLDADDMFERSLLDKFLILLETVDADVVVNDFNTFRENEGKKLNSYSFPNDHLIPITEIFATKSFVPMHSITYKSSIFKKFCYHQTEGISYTDMQWNSIPLLYADNFIYCKMPLYIYRLGREGQTMDPKVIAQKMDDEIMCTEDTIKFLNDAKNISESSALYLTERCLERCTNIYSNVIIGHNGTFDSLDKFDKFIREENHELYQTTESSIVNPYVRFRYIAYWRKLHRGLPIRIRLLLFAVQTLSAINLHKRHRL